MKRSRFIEEQIIAVFKEQEGEMPTAEVFSISHAPDDLVSFVKGQTSFGT